MPYRLCKVPNTLFYGEEAIDCERTRVSARGSYRPHGISNAAKCNAMGKQQHCSKGDPYAVESYQVSG